MVMAGWTNPMTVLSGLMAWLMLSGVIALRRQQRANDEEHVEKVLVALTAGGLAATTLFFGLMMIQIVLAIMSAPAVAAAPT